MAAVPFYAFPYAASKWSSIAARRAIQASQAATISSDDGIGGLRCKLSTPELKIAGEIVLVFGILMMDTKGVCPC
jgi:hypothetical protein